MVGLDQVLLRQGKILTWVNSLAGILFGIIIMGKIGIGLGQPRVGQCKP